jgi:hypothetical protein
MEWRFKGGSVLRLTGAEAWRSWQVHAKVETTVHDNNCLVPGWQHSVRWQCKCQAGKRHAQQAGGGAAILGLCEGHLF